MTFFKQNKLLMIVAVAAHLISNLSFAQNTTRRYIDSLLNVSDTNYKNETDFFFVVNGIPYVTSQLDTIISKYDVKYLADAIFISREKQSYPFYRNVVLLAFASKQKNKTKKKNWKEARKLFNDPGNISVHLLIDNIQIAPDETRKTFNSIKLNEIMYLYIKNDENQKQIKIWRTQ